MTQIKEKAVDLIRQMPEDHMFYVIDMLQNLKISIADKENEKNRLWRHFKIYKSLEAGCRKTLMLTKNWKKQGMKNMVILVDTNIVVDAVTERHPFAGYANIIIEKVPEGKLLAF